MEGEGSPDALGFENVIFLGVTAAPGAALGRCSFAASSCRSRSSFFLICRASAVRAKMARAATTASRNRENMGSMYGAYRSGRGGSTLRWAYSRTAYLCGCYCLLAACGEFAEDMEMYC